MNQILAQIKSWLELTGLGDSITTMISAIIILIIGWIIAKFISRIIKKLINKTNIDKNVSSKMNTASLISKLAYYLCMLFVLTIVLETIGITQVLDPIKNMLTEFFGFVPNLLAAGIIGFAGYIIATVVSNLITLSGKIIHSLAKKAGLDDTEKLTNIIKKIVFILILIPFVIQSLNALNLDAITNPVNLILAKCLGILPKIISASIILTLFYFGGKFLVSFLSDLLIKLGINELCTKLKLNTIVGEKQCFANIITNIIYFFIMFFAIITAVEIMELNQLTEILNNILTITGQIMFGLVILILGNFIASLVYDLLSKSESNKYIAAIARFGIIGIFLAISLSTMGIANAIVQLAFGLTLGSMAVAFALAYGLGGREAAGQHMKNIIDKINKNKE
jgi:hypothetical protein